MLYHGSKAEREVLRREIGKTTEIDGTWQCQPVVCTSYEVAMVDRQHLMSLNWKYLIVDEGHRIKNSQCRLIRYVIPRYLHMYIYLVCIPSSVYLVFCVTRELRLYDSTHRLLLTGTPLQNNLSELWSLLNFLLPEVFDDLDRSAGYELQSLLSRMALA